MSHPNNQPETDPRFPSGPWTGFFIENSYRPGKHQMELALDFAAGRMTGSGRDYVGRFTIDGVYHTDDGSCSWTKHYVGQHDVHYRGYNEGKGIWGTWEIHSYGVKLTGGFHIWPEGMADPTGETLSAAVDEPITVEELQTAGT